MRHVVGHSYRIGVPVTAHGLIYRHVESPVPASAVHIRTRAVLTKGVFSRVGAWHS